MDPPEQRLFEFDLANAAFRAGAAKGRWDVAEAAASPAEIKWPTAFFWLSAAQRENSPVRYYVRLDLSGYRSAPPTGRFWDPAEKVGLDFKKYPKGKPGSRVAMVFRTDWGESSRAFYHPYDRIAAQSHVEWPQKYPQLVWTSKNTIVDYLDEFQTLLHSGDYLGV